MQDKDAAKKIITEINELLEKINSKKTFMSNFLPEISLKEDDLFFVLRRFFGEKIKKNIKTIGRMGIIQTIETSPKAQKITFNEGVFNKLNDQGKLDFNEIAHKLKGRLEKIHHKIEQRQKTIDKFFNAISNVLNTIRNIEIKNPFAKDKTPAVSSHISETKKVTAEVTVPESKKSVAKDHVSKSEKPHKKSSKKKVQKEAPQKQKTIKKAVSEINKNSLEPVPKLTQKFEEMAKRNTQQISVETPKSQEKPNSPVASTPIKPTEKEITVPTSYQKSPPLKANTSVKISAKLLEDSPNNNASPENVLKKETSNGDKNTSLAAQPKKVEDSPSVTSTHEEDLPKRGLVSARVANFENPIKNKPDKKIIPTPAADKSDSMEKAKKRLEEKFSPKKTARKKIKSVKKSVSPEATKLTPAPISKNSEAVSLGTSEHTIYNTQAPVDNTPPTSKSQADFCKQLYYFDKVINTLDPKKENEALQKLSVLISQLNAVKKLKNNGITGKTLLDDYFLAPSKNIIHKGKNEERTLISAGCKSLRSCLKELYENIELHIKTNQYTMADKYFINPSFKAIIKEIEDAENSNTAMAVQPVKPFFN